MCKVNDDGIYEICMIMYGKRKCILEIVISMNGFMSYV